MRTQRCLTFVLMQHGIANLHVIFESAARNHKEMMRRQQARDNSILPTNTGSRQNIYPHNFTASPSSIFPDSPHIYDYWYLVSVAVPPELVELDLFGASSGYCTFWLWTSSISWTPYFFPIPVESFQSDISCSARYQSLSSSSQPLPNIYIIGS